MEEDRRNIEASRIKLSLRTILCVVCLLLTPSIVSSSQDDVGHSKKLTVTEDPGPASSSERTSNAIPEAEQSTSEILKKYGSKKSSGDSASVTDQQLEKPYPYYKSQVSKKPITSDNDIRQSKRSGTPDVGINGTLVVSISESSSIKPEETTTEETTETESTTTEQVTETVTDIETETTDETITTTCQPTETTPFEDDTQDINWSTLETTTTPVAETTQRVPFVNTQPSTNNPISTTEKGTMSSNAPVSSTVEATTTGSTTPTTTTMTLTESTVPATSTAPTTISTSSQSEEVSSESTDALPTSTESTTATNTEESSSTVTSEGPLPITATVATTASTTTTSTTPETVSTVATTTTTTTTSTTTTTESPEVIPESTVTTPMATTSPPATTPMTTARKVSSSSPKSEKPLPATTTLPTETFSSASTVQVVSTQESTTDAISPTLPTEDVTLLIRIVFEGTWQDVCEKLPVLRKSLANLINGSDLEKTVTPTQIIFHQTQCLDNLKPSSLMSETSLTSVLVYVVDENGSFDVTLTKSLPSLYENSPIDFPLTVHSFVLVQEAGSGNTIAVVIVSCVAFICLILLAGLFFIMRKRQGRFNYGERCRPVSLDAYSLDSVSAYNSVRRSKNALRCSKRSYGNPTFEDSSTIPTHPLNFAGISSFCSDENAISEEFASIPQVSSKIDELPPGAELKNRYANVIPLPETRVPLQRLNNDPLTEYINASYIRGPKNANKYYIGCQAPMESTVSDFWRMIWEQQCKVIIMLTDLVENGVEKCTEYIPPLEVSDCHRLYGDYQVTLKKREAKEKYAISTLHLKNLENNTFREVFHIWYLWPPSGTPTDAAGLIAVLLEARALQRGAAGPIVVHCSPGTGRTGTLIALDLGIRQYEITRTVDVPRVVYTIRRDRAGSVQTREQYAIIYKGLNLYSGKLAGGAIESA